MRTCHHEPARPRIRRIDTFLIPRSPSERRSNALLPATNDPHRPLRPIAAVRYPTFTRFARHMASAQMPLRATFLDLLPPPEVPHG